MYARFVGILGAIFVMVALGCQNRPGVSQLSEDEQTVEKDMGTEEPKSLQEVDPAPILQEANELEISEPPSLQAPVQESVAASDLPAVEKDSVANDTAPLNIHCSEEDLDKDESKRWRRCYLGYEEQDKIRPILAKALDVAMEEVNVSSSGEAMGPWLSSYYLSGSYHVGELPPDRVTSSFVIDANSRTLLSPSKENVATIFRNLKVFSDKPKPFHARAFALLLYWGVADRSLRLTESKRYRHRRGICVELTLQTRPHPQERAAIRKETRAYLITKDYDIEELPSCR